MQELIQSLPAPIQNYIKAETPASMKMMAASGRLPLPPQQMGIVLYALAHDPNQQIAQKALESLREQPHSILEPVLNHPKADPALLHFFAYYFSHDAKVLETVIRSQHTPAEILAQLALQVQEPLLGLIVQNQARHIESHEILQNLLKNPETTGSQRTRLLEFALREKIETGYSLEELSRYIHPELLYELFPKEEVKAASAAVEETFEESVVEAMTDFVPPEFFDEESLGEPEEEKKLTIEQQVLQMSITEKIVAASRGNKQIRGMLIRAGNRLISTAVLTNPRLTEGEVIKFAGNKGISEDVIRTITRNREWMKLYAVKVNLVGNPKCPIMIALRLLNHLRLHDLRQLCYNKNIPSTVAVNAKKLAKARRN